MLCDNDSERVILILPEQAWCMLCHSLVARHGEQVFHTGFRHISGVNYPLTVCSSCQFKAEKVAHLPDQFQATEIEPDSAPEVQVRNGFMQAFG